jgi:hypothetical protein
VRYGRVLLLVITAAVLQIGCNRADNSDAAIKKAIEDHLSGRAGLNSSEMVMEMKQVKVEGDNADADVQFRSRNDPKASMDFHYRLHRENKIWKVEQPAAGAAPHAMPPGQPEGGAPSGELPPGHPPTGDQQGAPGGKKM